MGEGPGAILSFETFLSFINRLLVTIQLMTNRGVLFLPPSDAYVRSFLYLLYTLIKLYYTKALSNQASSLAPDWILLLQRSRIPASLCGSATTCHLGGSSRILQDKVRMFGALVLCSPREHVFWCTLLTTVCLCEWMTRPAQSKLWAVPAVRFHDAA